MSALAPLAAVLLALTGSLVAALVGARAARPLAERVASALLLGLVLVPAAYVWAAVLVGPPSIAAGRALVLVPAALGLALLVRRRGRAHGVRVERARRWRPLERVGLALVLGFGAFALFCAASMPVHVFDPLFHFAHKGQLLFHEGFAAEAWSDLDGAVGRPLTHPRYPPGLPALYCVVAALAGAFDPDQTRPLFALFALAPAAWLYAALAPRGRAPALAAALLWLALPLVYFVRLPSAQPAWAAIGLVLGRDAASATFPAGAPFQRAHGWVLDGGGDLPLAALIFGACLHLARALPSSRVAGERADAWIAGFLLGGALLVKNEGLALAALVALCFAVAALRERAGRGRALGALGLALAVALVVAGPWLWLRRAIPSVDENYPALLRPATIATGLARAPTVLAALAASLGSPLRFGLVWPLFAVALVLARWRELARGEALFSLLVVLGALGLYTLVLLVTPWRLEHLFEFAIPDRLVLHVTPLAILFTLRCLWRVGGAP